MTEGQKNRLLGTLVAVDQIRAQIARAAREGTSPAQSGRALTPLDDASWREIEAALDRVSERARALAGQFAGEALRAREAPEPVGATFYWIAFLLRRLDEEVVADLEPERMARFGALPVEARAALDEAVGQMRAEIGGLQTRVAALRRESAGGPTA
jgi:hypothetical protein